MESNKQLTLKKVLETEYVREGIINSIFSGDIVTAEVALDSAIEFINNENNKGESSICTIHATDNDTNISFENHLYKKEFYLLESRAFNKETDKMIGSYLMVMENDTNPTDFNDDAWGTTDWIPV